MTSPADVKKKAPDGGWGWFVCLGSSLITLSLRSLDPSFGLLFHDPLEELEIDSTGTSLIMSILDAIVNFSGLLIGPLLKKYSYRKVAFFGSLLSCTGLILTSRANSMFHIICTYSILGGLGTGLAIASSFVALNTFFDKKRGQAVGFSMAGTALAMMLVPQFIHLLLDSYGFRGAMLVVGAWAMHSAVGACLLRPLEVKNTKPVKKNTIASFLLKNFPRFIRNLVPETNISGTEISINRRKLDVNISSEIDTLLQRNSNGVIKKIENGAEDLKNDTAKNEEKVEVEEKFKDEFLEKIKETFDLDLLKDSVYLNVIIGSSLYYVAESNFKLMTPFFLASIGMNNVEIASCLSITAFTDILARLLLPTIFDRLGFKKRTVFWVFCMLVGIGRSIMAEQSKGIFLIVTFVIIGFLRGATLVNLNLSVSECCSLKKLPSAFGMFMVSKGLFVVIMSPLIGYIRDSSKSYTICIHVMTFMISITFITWSIEFMYQMLEKRRSALAKQAQNQLSILPIQQCFGLIFRERFFSLGITATQTSLILHLCGTITCSLGLISGPMMKRFTFRKVAFLGGFTAAIGVCMTAFAVSLPSIILTYCVIVGIGHGIMFPATSLAMNSYFRKKRNVAMGLSVTLTGLGPILMPLLIAILLENYATTGTLLILAGIAAHSLVGASLLKPFKEKENNEGNMQYFLVTVDHIHFTIDKILLFTRVCRGSLPSQNSKDESRISAHSQISFLDIIPSSAELKIENESSDKNDAVHCRLLNAESEREMKKSEQYPSEDTKLESTKEEKRSALANLSENLDLALLKDSRYVAIILGMGVSLVAETNFNAMIPFVLTELSGLERTSIATIMSIQAVSDITGRLCVPFLAQKAGWTSRNLYAMSLLGSTLGRTILSTWGNTYIVVICVALIIGVAKGTKAVFQALIIPDYVPLERLPAASGMQMVCNGILSITIGPIIGLVHDTTKSYVGALHFTSILSLSCVVLWYIGGLWQFKKSSGNLDTKKEAIEIERDALECNA
ncbi:Monocarboxylate transporter 12 [Habropoda laboriosa]|uniref:Monocarboxylate transporter 12 n=1 Tax=Habropoda laboriosa TaxID=597456 RepID=A0A0L7R3M1_9HYME|nr:Monocarboxylate transporter 12 [Habropoda laboriosa]